MIGRIWTWLNNTDPGTWQGHYWQGIGGFWVGYLPVRHFLDAPLVVEVAAAVGAGILTAYLIVIAVFAHREGDNYLAAVKKYGKRLAVRKKGLDGWMDFTMPILGCATSANLLLGGISAMLGSVAGSMAYWGIVVMWKKRG